MLERHPYLSEIHGMSIVKFRRLNLFYGSFFNSMIIVLYDN